MTNTTSRFTGKTVLVTGASSGIGLAGAQRLLAEGATVIGTGRTPAHLDHARTVLGERAHLVRADLATADGVAAVTDAARAHGPLNGLWLNAGYAMITGLDVDGGAFDAAMAANVRAPFLLMAALQDDVRDGGAVLVTGSASAYEAQAGLPLYAASKAAVGAAARNWAAALAPRRIRVNTLVPGPITSRLRDAIPDGQRDAFEEELATTVLLGRVGDPAEAAAAAAFLLSTDASYVTGAELVVDGGLVFR